MRVTINDVVESINYEKARWQIVSYLRDYVEKARVKGAVVGLSGGVDSSTVAKLAAEVLTPRKVIGLILPTRFTPGQDVEDAVALAKDLGIKYYVIDISNILSSFAAAISHYDDNHLVARGNLVARIRMSVLYYYANKYNMLVLGTGDKSELMLGYFTKYGDGGVDILPIGDLYKTHREMARRLGIPPQIYKKPSSPRLWPGHWAEELGITYNEADLVLFSLELGLSIRQIPKATGV